MPPDRPLSPTSLPHLQVMLTDDGSRTLRDSLLGETFHSGCGALSECWHVYLINSGIGELLTAEAGSERTVRVLELGFGTGMGWLVTAAAAAVHQTALEYVSVENNLLPVDVLAQIDTASAVHRGVADGWIPSAFEMMSSIEQPWLNYLSRMSSKDHDIEYQVSPTNHLRLVQRDVRQWLGSMEMNATEMDLFDAVYFDAFSPATNPELWQAELFASIKRYLKPAGKLVSYCVSGDVRRGLQSAGFRIERRPGPPRGKREVLVAY